jgi:hypothetical protein
MLELVLQLVMKQCLGASPSSGREITLRLHRVELHNLPN